MKNKTMNQKRVKKYGTRAFVGAAVLLAVLIAVNALAACLPASVTRFDVTGRGLSELAPETSKFLGELDEDVTLYWICEGGEIDTALVGDWFDLLLARYAERSDRITVKRVDPKADKAFAEKYGTDDYNNHSVVVESARRFTAVDLSQYYKYSNAYVNSVVGGEYIMSMEELENMQYYIYYAYEGVDILQYPSYQHACVNAVLTAALDYVTVESIPHGYVLTGFDGTPMSEDLTEYLAIMTPDLETLDISAVTAIPDDAGCVVLFAPEADLSEAQAATVKAYLDRGGSLVLATSPTTVQSLPNILRLTAEFGLSAAPGLLVDSKSGYYAAGASTDVLTPSVNQSHDVYAVYEQKVTPRMPQSHAITAAATLPEGVSVLPMFTTSDAATRREIGNVTSTLGEAGKYHVAMTAQRQVALSDGTTTAATLTWFGSADAFNAENAAATEDGNYFYFAFAFASINREFSSTYENIPSVRLTVDSLTGISTPTMIVLIALIAVVIPFGLLTVGIVVWVRRKNRRG